MADVVILLSNEADRAQVQPCYDRLHGLGILVSLRLASAHLSPAIVQEAVGEAEDEGAKVFICADQGAAHLAGAVASQSVRPVIGLPLASGALGMRRRIVQHRQYACRSTGCDGEHWWC